MSKIDDIDIKIVKNLYNLKKDETITTYSLAKKIFKENNEKNKSRFFTDKANYIDYRMENLAKAGIIEITNNGKKVYTLILNNVKKKIKKIRVEEFKLKINGEWKTYF